MAAKKATNFISVDALDDYAVRFTLNIYPNIALTAVANGTYDIVSNASFDKNGIDYTRIHPICTGPFKFVEYVRDSS
jgi:ABC-type transport system substrate-binding protein